MQPPAKGSFGYYIHPGTGNRSHLVSTSANEEGGYRCRGERCRLFTPRPAWVDCRYIGVRRHPRSSSNSTYCHSSLQSPRSSRSDVVVPPPDPDCPGLTSIGIAEVPTPGLTDVGNAAQMRDWAGRGFRWPRPCRGIINRPQLRPRSAFR